MNSITSQFLRRPGRALGIALLLLLLLAGVAGCDKAKKAEKAVTTMPPFTLVSVMDGATIDSNDLRGQTLLITFFATWCAPCRQEVPTLVALQNRYGERNFSVLGISVDQGDDRVVRNFIMEMGINYPVAMSAPDTPKNFGNVFGIPTTFLIDPNGNIIQRFDGYVEIMVLEQALQAILD